MSEPRVHLFMDYQNVHLSVGEAFAPPGTPAHTTLIHPGRFGDALMAARAAKGRTGTLERIHVYRGQPSSTHEPDPAAWNKAQSAEWSRDPRVAMFNRPLRYPRDWPNNRAREKGVDVKLAIDFVRAGIEKSADVLILASRDTDLMPAIETVMDIGGSTVEICTWVGCSRLRLGRDYSAHHLWCTYLDGASYVASKDPKKY
ncbi:NYN domain-containing protein [Xylanimonas protaetiae]|uniref:NYN domain-containing protein n=1 Tax=Xylanimonas protaetiae TaxID=2509457 RepID=A0A4P6F385_9MICO|nr:NYN domain-containing protein [Xylanimonas protaetiae]QAY69984.1 NYN domain-containing protein [Xylanimonas protaetiae]